MGQEGSVAQKIFDSSFFAGLHQMKLAAGIKMDGGMSGNRKSAAKGSSVEFSDFREYMLGDDIRRIDWNAYGRLDKLYVKEFMQEREGFLTVLLDGSQSMDFGRSSKGVCGQRIAGALGYLALANLDRVRFGCLKTAPVVHRSLTGRQSLDRLLQQIGMVEFGGKTDLYQGVKQISFPRRGMTAVISDFFDKETGRENLSALQELIKYLRYQHQEVLLIQVLSEEEERPAMEGTVGLIDSETQEEMVLTMSNGLLREYQQAVRQFCKALQEMCSHYQAYYVHISSEEGLAAFLYQARRSGVLVT